MVTADCAVSRIPPRDLWLHTRLARVERGIEIVQVPISHIVMKKENDRIRCMLLRRMQRGLVWQCKQQRPHRVTQTHPGLAPEHVV